MKFNSLFLKKQSGLIINIMILSFLFLPLIIPLYQREFISQKNMVSPVQALENASSFNPRVCLSGSETTHLIFEHYIKDDDQVLYVYYHSYEYKNGSWSLPKKCFGDSHDITIFSIKPEEEGFILYYCDKTVLYSLNFYEQNDTWGNRHKLFGVIDIVNFLNISEIESYTISYSIHSFLLLEDGSCLIAWKFTFKSLTSLSHELEGIFIVSKIDTSGSITSEPIYGLEGVQQTTEDVFFCSRQ